MSSIQWSAQKPTSLSTSTPSSSGSHATVFFSFSNPAKACLCLKRQSCVIKFFLDIEILPSNLEPRDSTNAHQGFTYERDLHGCSTDWVTVAWMYDDSILSKIINQVESCIGLGGIRGTMLPAMITDFFNFLWKVLHAYHFFKNYSAQLRPDSSSYEGSDLLHLFPFLLLILRVLTLDLYL